MRAAKTIDELYRDTKEYDMVIANDAPLVTALNNRIDSPRIGRFASTPRMIAGDIEDMELERLMINGECSKTGRGGLISDIDIIRTISDETGYDIRFVHGEVENIRKIRRYTQRVEEHLHGKASKKIYESFTKLPTTELVMDSFNALDQKIFEGKRIAVIGLDFFDDLDKHFIPNSFDEIDAFCEKEYSIDKIYAVGNDRQIAEHAVDIIDNENAEDIAIVMDTASSIADAVRSSLYRKEISFKNAMSARDIAHVRDFISFLSLSMSYEILTVGDVRELIANYGGSLKHVHDEYLFSRETGMTEPTSKLCDVMKNVRDMTFRSVSETIVNNKNKGTVNMILDELRISDTKITEQTVESASYLIDAMEGLRHNAEIPDSEKSGVLLADCSNSVYIDRPVVIYLGLDQGWSRTAIGKDYIDKEKEGDIQLQKFQILVQQGISRIYIVNTMKNGRRARPCLHFDMINTDGKKKIRAETFDRLVGTEVVRMPWIEEHITEIPKRGEFFAEPKEFNAFSKSALDRYASCPRGYMFGELVKTADAESTVLGSIMHEFAEFCVCHPERVEEGGIDSFVDKISELCAGITCPEKRDLDRSEITMMAENVFRFIRSLNIKDPLLNIDASAREYPNRFMLQTDKYSEIAECERLASNSKLFGKFDLLIDGTIVDHKTGRAKGNSEISREMDMSSRPEYLELQSLVYLSILDETSEKKGPKKFVIFYMLDNESENIKDPEYDIRKNCRTVCLLDFDDSEFIRRGYVADHVIKTKKYEFVDEMREVFADALISGDPRTWDTDPNVADKIQSALKKKGDVKGLLAKCKKLMEGVTINTENILYLTQNRVATFRESVKMMHLKATEEYVSGYPCAPLKSCDRCHYFPICTGGLEDDESE